MIKKILLSVLVLVIIGVCTGFYMWNRKETPIEKLETTSKTAVELTKDYALNEKTADSLYLGKPLELSGIIEEVSKNQEGAVVITLASGDPMAGVQCTMRERGVEVKKGQSVIIRGKCKGNNMGVVLTECIIK